MASISFSGITGTLATITVSGLYSHFSSGDTLSAYISIYDNKTGEQVDYFENESWTLYSDTYNQTVSRLQPSTTYKVEATIEKNSIIFGRSSSDDGISTASTSAVAVGTFTTDDLSVDISFSNDTISSVDVLISGLSTDFGSYQDVDLTLYVYKNGSVYDTYSSSDISGDSSYERTLSGLSEGITYTLRAVIEIIPTIIFGSLTEIDVVPSNKRGTYILEKDFVLGGGGSGSDDDYVPSFDNLVIAEDTSKKTSSRLGIYLTGLDTNFKGTWEITQLYTKSGTYYVYAAGNGNPSITFSGGKSKSDTYLLTGLSADTSHRIYVTLQCTVNGTVYKKTIQSTSYFYTDEPDDSYYPDLDDLRVVIESIGTNRITVHAEGLDPNYSYGDWEILWHIIETNNGNSDWEHVYDEDIPAGSTETGSVFITELKQNTYYDIRVTVRFRYNGSWYSEYAYPDEPIKTGTDASYVPDISNQGLTLGETSAPDDYSLRLRVERLDAAYSGNWSITYYVTSNDTTVKTKTATQSGGVSNSAYTTISGLQSGTGYDVYAVVKVAVSGKTYSWTTETCWFVTSGNVAVEDTYGGALDAELVLTQGDNGTWIGAEIVGLDTSYTDPGRYVWWYLNGEFWDSDEIPKRASGINYEFEGLDLQSGGQYRVTAEIHYILSDDSDGIYTLEEWLQADEIIDFTSAVIVPDTRTSSSLVVYVAGLDTSYSRSDRSIEWYLNGTYKGRTTLRAYASTSTNYTFSSLTKSTLYTVMARIYYTFGGSSTYKDVTIQMFTLFEWDAQKVSGGDFNITASEWKKLLDYIKAVRQYKGFAAGSYTYPSKGDDFLASHYNQALNRITGISGSGYNANAVSSGDTIYASAINFLRDEINRLSEPDYE